MNKTVIVKFLGIIFLLFGCASLAPLGSAYYAEHDISMWLLGTALYFLLGISGLISGARASLQRDLGLTEGITATVIGYLSASAVAGISLWLAQKHCTYLQAWFECMSGLTTTGASIFDHQYHNDYSLSHIMPSAILWRAILQWIGGLFFVIISIALIPLLAGGTGSKLHIADIPGLSANRLSDRLIAAAKTISVLYLLMTALIYIGLMLCGSNTFHAACHAMACVSTGGFSSFDHNVEGFQSAAAEWVLILGMLLSAINFNLLVSAIRGKPLSIWRNTEARWFLMIITFGCAICTAVLYHHHIPYSNTADLVRDSIFQVVSFATTTGFQTGVDTGPGAWNNWPSGCMILLAILMICGGCSSSTAGGIKIIRIALSITAARSELRRFMEPARVTPMLIEGRSLHERVIFQVAAYIAIYGFTITIGTLLFCIFGNQLGFSFGLSLSAVANIGAVFGNMQNGNSLSQLNDASLVLSIILMLLGRLELIGVLITLRPKNWRN